MNAIFKVWNMQPEGYVSLPAKQEDKWVEKSFKYPQDIEKIIKWIKYNIKLHYNIYWCPTVLTNPRRIIENIPKLYVLYADLDEASPFNIPEDLKPTIAWETSTGRYAAIWTLDKPIDAKEGQEYNKRLTYFLDADKGGWDLTQVLRIPGMPNFKYDPPRPGKLLWDNGRTYNINTFKSLPEVVVDNTVDNVDIDELDKDINTIIYEHIDKLNNKVIKLLLTPEHEVNMNDRSATLWELECMLVESGLNKDEIYTVVKNCIWNKYRGRKDEEKRLKLEIEKAFNNTEVKTIDLTKPEIKITTYSDLMTKKIDKPKWLIKDWWEAGSHGMLAGEPKTYKSTISTEIAVSVASGKPLFNQFEVVDPGPVLIVQEENSEWLMQDRLFKVSNSKGLYGDTPTLSGNTLQIQSPPELPIYMVNRQRFNLTEDYYREQLLKLCDDIKPHLIILDPLYLMLGSVDMNSASELNDVLSWLLSLSEYTNSALMVVHHFNKNGNSSRGGQRMLGSVTYHAWVQSAIYNRVSEGKKATITVEREFRSFTPVDDIEISFKMGEPGDPYYEVEIIDSDLSLINQITVLLTGKQMTISQLVNALNRPQKEIEYTLSIMIKSGTVRVNKNKYTIKEG